MGERPALKRRDDRESPGPVEKGIMALSAAVTLFVFGYLVWHAWVTPMDEPPAATAEVVGTDPEGNVLVQVTLRNPAGVGLREAQVGVDCEDPPVEVVFHNVPSLGKREATVTCPPGTSAPTASVGWWVRT